MTDVPRRQTGAVPEMLDTVPSALVARLREALRGDRGAVTAEFVVVLPAAMLVLGLALGGVMLGAHRIALVALVGEVVRLEARGDTALAAARLAEAGASLEVRRDRIDELFCVTLTERPGGGLLAAIALSARACAAVSGNGPAS